MQKMSKEWEEQRAQYEMRFHVLSEKSVDSRTAAAELENEVQNLQASEERRSSSASQSNGCCFDPEIGATPRDGSSRGNAAAHLSSGRRQQSYGGQQRPEPTAPERGAGAEEREAWEEEWDEDERMANGWYEKAAHGSVVDPAEGSDEIQALQELEHALVTIPDPRGGKKTRKAIKWEMKGSLEAEWRQVSSRREERRKTARERTQKSFKKTAREGIPVHQKETARVRTQGHLDKTAKAGDLRTLETNSQGRDPRTLKEPVERWRVQKKKWKKKRKKKMKKVKHRRRSWWKKYCEKMASLFTAGRKEENKGKKDQMKNRRPRARQVLGKSGRWLSLLLLLEQNWLCVNAAEGLQRRTEMMERMRSGKREQMDGGDSTKVEAAKRRRQD